MKHVDISDLILDTSNREKHSYSFQYIIIIITLILTTLFIFSILKEDKKNIDTIKIVEKKIIIEKKPIIKIKEEKNIIKKDISTLIIEKNNTNLRYIQVGIFKNEINKKQLKTLTENNFKFIERKGNKFSKILIGPYDNYKAATLDLKLIKSKFRKDSFITK